MRYRQERWIDHTTKEISHTGLQGRVWWQMTKEYADVDPICTIGQEASDPTNNLWMGAIFLQLTVNETVAHRVKCLGKKNCGRPRQQPSYRRCVLSPNPPLPDSPICRTVWGRKYGFGNAVPLKSCSRTLQNEEGSIKVFTYRDLHLHLIL